MMLVFGTVFFGTVHKAYAVTVVCAPVGPCPASIPVTLISAQVLPTGGNNNGGGGSGVSPEIIKNILITADYNKDNRVDIIDLSILLFFYGQSGPLVTRYDLNKDGKIGLEDISVMLYYWTLL